MNCASCGHENPEKAKFCLECGQAFALRCSSCATELPAGAKYCLECGTPTSGSTPGSHAERAPSDYTPKHLADKILQSKSALEGERKQVTVMFADVTRSMELAEALDPEEWHGILDGFFRILADGVHRFEGTINQYTGDGIMALFGAPLAHEDHAQRACYAALHLREELSRYATEVKREHGIGLSVRMGLNSGDVVVGKIGDDLRMDYTAQGHTVGLAQRMESLASPDTCYVSDATASLATGYFALEDLGEFKVKGATEPVVVHRLLGVGDARTRFDVSRSRGLTRFVGRDADMRLVEDALAQARSGNGQAVGIVAPAGTGKSRLCFEFTERLRSERLEVFVGRAVAHGKNIPFLPILELFRAYFGVEDDDADRTVREKVAGKLLLIDDGLRGDLHVLFEFFGVPDPDETAPRLDPEARQRKLFGLMHRLARDDQGENPRVYLLEDLHWLDQASEAFVEQLVESVAGTRNLLILNFRPEYHAEWMGRSWYRQLPLAPLGADAIRELLDDLLGSDPSTRGLGDAIHERTGGNPFFTEEVVQSLIESGKLEGSRGAYHLVTPIAELGVPPSVQAVLSARIDRLPERDKRVLQAASVIGKDFSRPILADVVDEADRELDAALASLRENEFLYERSLYPVAEYTFKHPLTQEVAQHSLLRERQRELHGRVAQAVEQARADSLDENAALLAHHWDEAGEARKASNWHRRAALWIGSTDADESMRHWARVRELMRGMSDPESDELQLAACRGLLSQGWRLGVDLGDAYQEAREIAERNEDRDTACLMLALYSRSLAAQGEIARYVELNDECMRLAPGVSDVAIRANPWVLGLDASWFIGDVGRSLRLRHEYLENFPPDPALGAEIWGFGLYPVGLMLGGVGLSLAARFEEAESDLRRAAELGSELEYFDVTSWCYAHIAEIAWLRGDPAAVTACAQRAAEYAERSGNSAQSRVYAARAGVQSLLAVGSWAEAETAAQSWLAIYEQERVELIEKPAAFALQSEARRRAGRFEAAVEAAEQGLLLAQQMPRRIIELSLRLPHAVSLAHLGTTTEAKGSLDAAASLLEVTGAEAWRPFLHEARAELAGVLGDTATRERELREAHRVFTEHGCSGRAEQIARELPSTSDGATE